MARALAADVREFSRGLQDDLAILVVRRNEQGQAAAVQAVEEAEASRGRVNAAAARALDEVEAAQGVVEVSVLKDAEDES